MDDKVKIIWSCNGQTYDERTVPNGSCLIDDILHLLIDNA